VQKIFINIISKIFQIKQKETKINCNGCKKEYYLFGIIPIFIFEENIETK